MTELEVADFLRREGLWFGAPQIAVMQGGYTNEVLRVMTGDRRFVLKHFAAAASGTLFPNVPEDEARALKRLAGLHVAPDLIGSWPEHSILVYDYVQGQHWDGDVAAVARLLIRKERAEATGFRNVSLNPEDILSEGDVFFGRCKKRPSRLRPEPLPVKQPPRLSLIHTDIGASNLIGMGNGLRLIDWQCPAQGDLCEDIHSFLSPAFQILSLRKPLDSISVSDFFGHLDRPDAAARYRRLRPAFSWRMAGYCAWRSEVLTDPVVTERYRLAAEAELNAMELAA